MSENDNIEALKAIAHPVRLRLLHALKDGERNVGDIEAASGVGQPALSQQLAVLRKAELVETRKEAKMVYYSLAREALGELAEMLTALAGTQAEAPAPAAAVRTPTPGVATFARLS
ncbi:ArsR/SmtB family transcription factor [Croceicoccus mobilis]|uniref:HTH arsR-type domain-containing protein n=1 Tax=Croceicoccus mobilis TaxID=1703339 RepID=A0A917DTU4_9SPHN|nr:metalloregulator ArsR/SmtB family transcription factor [Croceicoccus mobilis]GGD69817.1 hypothetical protein GCM10010990_19190 [Croceicoccus mobilis]